MSNLTTKEVIDNLDDVGYIANYVWDIYNKYFPNFPTSKGIIKSTAEDGALFCWLRMVDNSEYIIMVHNDIPCLLPTDYPYVKW
jgi:hypothetical protein